MPAVGLLAVALAVAALVALHVVGRSLSPVQRTISEYALIGPAQRALFGVFALCLAVAAFAVLVGAWSRPVAAVSLAVFTLGTTVAALVNLGILRLWFGRVVGRPRKAGWLRDLALMILANAVLAAVALGAWHGIARALEAVAWPRGLFRVVHGVALLATITLGFGTYVGVLRLFRVRGAEDLWELPRKVLRRLRPRPAR